MAGKRSSATPDARFETPCRSCPLRKLDTFRRFSPDELGFVEKFKVGELKAGSGRNVLVEGHNSPHLYTVLFGWLFKYKMLEDGRRQIINYAVPGDLLGLQGAVFDRMQHSIEALTDVTLCVLDKQRLWELYRVHHGLAFDITWIAAQEKAILADFLVSAGQRSASERIAFLLLTLFRRARHAGLVDGNSVRLPITQEHFADTIGFSLVHTNKRLNRLRHIGIFDWRGEIFTLHDESALVELAGQPPELARLRPFL